MAMAGDWAQQEIAQSSAQMGKAHEGMLRERVEQYNRAQKNNVGVRNQSVKAAGQGAAPLERRS
jgi:hypothetical protein